MAYFIKSTGKFTGPAYAIAHMYDGPSGYFGLVPAPPNTTWFNNYHGLFMVPASGLGWAVDLCPDPGQTAPMVIQALADSTIFQNGNQPGPLTCRLRIWLSDYYAGPGYMPDFNVPPAAPPYYDATISVDISGFPRFTPGTQTYPQMITPGSGQDFFDINGFI